jgi:hypothetical protein
LEILDRPGNILARGQSRQKRIEELSVVAVIFVVVSSSAIAGAATWCVTRHGQNLMKRLALVRFFRDGWG